MASVTKIKKGLYSISWGSVNIVSPKCQVAVSKLPNVFESCQLTSHNINEQQIFLAMKLVLPRTSKAPNIETISVFASRDGNSRQKMTLNQGKFTTSWLSSKPLRTSIACDSCGYGCTLTSTTSFDILIDLNPEDSTVSMRKGAKHVLDHILKLWETKTLSDVTFKCKGEEIKAHILIVSASSPVLAVMFTNDFKENREKVVDVTDITPVTLSRLLRFMYIGDALLKTDVSEEEITELLIAADKYGVETLKEDCAQHLSRNVKVENAAHFLVLAHLHNSSVLLESTFGFLSKNAKAVCSRKDWMDIIKNYPELCFQATQFMFGH